MRTVLEFQGERHELKPERRLSYEEIYRNLDGMTALAAAERTTMGKTRGEKDTEFVKRIVATYAFVAQHDPDLKD